ncbi:MULTISPECIES: acyloxyacyl hydrolase [Bacteroides]|jgi:hypothetical protein|uniref:Lipid A 3-O-deacylase n=1 Tax=Bacteroides graminisolvens DSM 19988 = JCM 15093 TaxID=1121097 RepID=A0A069D2H6_9BACE|nr:MULTISPECIES: acyloxyacyl hydrolase [Bacteroides]GAK36602.1 hypothetical protein JCM15093_1774 [Bacteroides graminisolvens DSM 19988 = JCM 15093]
MKRIINRIIAVLFAAGLSLNAMGTEIQQDSTRNYIPFMQIKSAGGTVLPTTPIVRGNKRIPWFNAVSLQYGYASTGRRWQDGVYGMPYMGVGLHLTDFSRNKDIGTPITLYLFYGAELKRLSPKLSIGYEGNLGYSFNWKPYDPALNPENGAIGARWAVFIAVEPHLRWNINPHLDLQAGVMLSHYSNGGTRKPNNGLNMFSPTLSLRYKFRQADRQPWSIEKPPLFKKHFEHDISVTASLRQIMIHSEKSDVRRPLNYNFDVTGLNYNFCIVPNYNYKYGISAHLVYDASSHAEIEVDGDQQSVRLAPFHRRLSLGVAAYGELVAEGFSLFANLGYNVVHNQQDKRFYQIIGLKCYLKENLYGTVGVNASNLSSAKFLFLSLGYTIRSKR